MSPRDQPKAEHASQPGEFFQQIDGIGPRSAKRLWDGGIRTLEDLASRTPEDLARATGRPAELIASQNWTGQARELIGPPPDASVPRQHYAAFHVEFLLESDNRVHHTRVRQHHTDAHDAWSGWDDERLIAFLRDHIPLPAAAAPAGEPSLEPANGEPDQPPDRGRPSRSRPSPPSPERLPPGSLIIEDLASVRDDQRSHIRSPNEPISVRFTIRINPTSTSIVESFDFSATVAAREFEGRDRSPVGTTEGAVRVGEPVSVEVVGTALPIGLYRLAVTVEIYRAGHSPEEPALDIQGAFGDLIQVATAPMEAAPAVA